MKKTIVLLALIVALGATTLQGTPPQATVTKPNGGEKILIGVHDYAITWMCSNCNDSANVVVEIYNTLHSGPGWSGQISPGGVPMKQKCFIWPVVGKLKDGSFLNPGAGYKIHLEAIDGSDASDNTFTLLKKLIIREIHPR